MRFRKMENIDLVLPCYNPPEDFERIVEHYFRDLQSFFPGREFNLFVVNDGSTTNFTDTQVQILRSIQNSVYIISYPQNMGKGYALRKAVANTSSPLVIYSDIDFPFKVESIIKVVEEFDKNADIVLVRRNHDYLNTLPYSRKFYSLMSKLLNRVILKLRYPDTQGGLKGFNCKGKEIFMQTTINEFLFDTEFVYRASLRKGISIVSIEGRTREDLKPNKISFKAIVRELINFIRITKIKTDGTAEF